MELFTFYNNASGKTTFRTLPTRASAVSRKTIVIPSGDATLLHQRTAARAKDLTLKD
jgi:hypothetical protein